LQKLTGWKEAFKEVVEREPQLLQDCSNNHPVWLDEQLVIEILNGDKKQNGKNLKTIELIPETSLQTIVNNKKSHPELSDDLENLIKEHLKSRKPTVSSVSQQTQALIPVPTQDCFFINTTPNAGPTQTGNTGAHRRFKPRISE